MLIIFDWDGTLCDSIEEIVAAMRSAAGELQLEPPEPERVRNIVGLGLAQAVEMLFPALPASRRGELASAYSRHYAAPERGPTPLFEGALDTLHGLRSRGLELAVATGKSRRGLDRVLAELELADFFDATRCADETRSKPHPQMLHELMSTRCKSPDEVVMVGDSAYDLEMAQNAGVRSVAVSFGVHDSAKLTRYEPLAVIDRLPELLDLALLQAGS